MPPAPVTIEPIAVRLDGVPAFGATWFGVGVRSIRVELDDGRTMRFDLPEAATREPLKIGETEREILDALAAVPYPMTRKQLAAACHKTTEKGRFGQAIKMLLEADTPPIFERNSELTDDLKKFPT